MTQLTLDNSDTRRIKVSAIDRCCTAPGDKRCWRAKCLDCGTWLTKHDFTEQDALELAATASCECKPDD